MKIKKFKRTIRPEKGSSAKPRAGVVEIVDGTPESFEEFSALIQEENDPLLKLQSITADAESFLINAGYYADQKEIYTKEIDPEIEAGSPEHCAISALRFAYQAQKSMEAGDIRGAVRNAMGASYNDVMLWFTSKWEPITARAVAQTLAPPKEKEKRKRWAVAIADDLIKQGFRTFPAAWESISDDEGNRYDGFEVYRDGDNLMAVKSGKQDKLPKQSFRTGYYSKQKNLK